MCINTEDVDAEVALLTSGERCTAGELRTQNPLVKSSEFLEVAQKQEEIAQIKKLKHSLEFYLYKGIYPPNIYKTIRAEAKKLDAEYRAAKEDAVKLQIKKKHKKIEEQYAALRDKIEEFCEEIFRLGNAALFKMPADEDEDSKFYKTMMDIVKEHTELYVPLASNTKENIEAIIIDSAKDNKSDGKPDKSSTASSFDARLAALNINRNPGPQPIPARPFSLHQLQGQNIKKPEDNGASTKSDQSNKC